ncbi:hypothetical protein D9Q98_008818 [Chlorella vulgaris]|uniref:SM/Sec1-family protein n=1 Tax=Chlorella vulgaris TaxID=3077 RepID=A0A9D4YUG4_CHLVU|nr:hypothetical protein D9Q98_008818 [Chlorella vulgaris]
MVLNVRQRQADAVVRMLHFNSPPGGKPGASGGSDDTYKVLVLDSHTKDILAPLLHVNELRRHGVTLHLMLDADRQPIPDVPAVYFVQPSEAAVARIIQDVQRGLYDAFHLNFSTHIPRPLMEKLAAGVVAGNAAARVARVYDQHNRFLSLEAGLFTLGLPDTYLQLNDPAAQDSQIEAAVSAVVDGLFCVLATLSVVPIIRCPRGGAAEHVAAALDAKLRDALAGRASLFAEGGGAAGLAASLQRPLLCLFDRNFELSVVLQHAWTYKPLVHDVLAMRLNRVSLQDAPLPGQAAGARKAYEVDDADFFWTGHGREQFPKIAEQVEVELGKYKQSIEELNRKTGSHLDPTADPAELMSSNTRNLMSAVSSLPELTEKKRVIDKHTNLATALLGCIKARQLDAYYALEEECISGKADAAAVTAQLQSPAGTPADKLRLALVWLLTCEMVPSEGECQAVEALLQGCGADMAAWSYVKRMRRLNLTGRQGGGAGAGSVSDGLSSFSGAASSQLTTLLGTTFGQGLSSLTKGVKNLLAGEQQAAVTVAVEALMDGRTGPDATDAYAVFDPKGPAGRAQRPPGPFKEALVFMVGGGNYLEAESLSCWASRAQPTPKHIIYGATDLLAGEDFLKQLSSLGYKSGAAAPPQ